MTKEEWGAIWKLEGDELDSQWAIKQEMHQREAGYYIISEEKNYQPYKSMKTGEMIEGRKQHREHLKQHGLVEVGNEQPKAKKMDYDSKGLKEALIRQVYR
jgi:hypothetical protein